MKKIFYLFTYTVLISNLSFGQKTPECTNIWEGPCLSKPVSNMITDIDCNEPWVQILNEDFSDPSTTFDKLLENWVVPYQGMVRGFFGDELQWYANTGTTPSIPLNHNIEISNGTLKLIAKKEEPAITGTYVSNYATDPWTYYTDNFNYTSAEIDTKLPYHYGKFEMMCKLPYGKGFWPAFWLCNGPPI